MMKSKLALAAIAALAGLVACSAPNRGNGTSPTGGTTNTGGGPPSGGNSANTGGASATTTATAGQSVSGGTSSAGGGPSSGGTTSAPGGTTSAAGATTGTGGQTTAGGTSGTGGRVGSGGTSTVGGRSGSGGATVAGGTTGSAGTSASGGTPTGGLGSGGTSAAAGTTARGGTTATGGAAGGSSGGSSGGGATGSAGATGKQGPCDIFAAANPATPCVAAHSTVRALYAGYTGNLYQVRNSTGTKDIPVGADGYVNISVQDSFCSSACTISIIYDQSPQHNDLVKSPTALWLPNGGDEAKASDGKITINGHTAHGIYVNNSGGSTGVGYRNNACKGLAKGDDPEMMYMVADGSFYNPWCCFDYGNAETNGSDSGNATMEALYWGNSTQWTRGSGNGPWFAADLENGMFECDSKTSCPTNTSVTGWAYVVGMLKGPSGNKMGIKAGNAQSGTLQVKFDGPRPSGYSPMKKQGSIILGTGGDGSNNAHGIFFEGAITSGNSSDASDDAVQANIVAAGYGK